MTGIRHGGPDRATGWVPMAGEAMTQVEPRPHPLAVDVVIDCSGWRNAVKDCEPLCVRALEVAAAEIPGLLGQTVEVTLLLTGDARIRDLNARFRNKDSATNVLSFPALDDGGQAALRGGGALPENPVPGPVQLGDIAVAFETVEREAESEGKPVGHHLSHLAIHGFLHLVGYDHQTGDEAEAMEALERDVLARLDIPNPYSL